MPNRQLLRPPKMWLMTDERLGDDLFASIAALPRGSGIVFRHYSLAKQERQVIFDMVSAAARRHRHILVVGGKKLKTRTWAVDGVHGSGRTRDWPIRTVAVHSLREAIAAKRLGADLLFVSPVFATMSHPGARVLGRSRFGLLIRRIDQPIIALGGMTPSRARGVQSMGIYGWAAISAFAVRCQKRNAVPT